MLFMTPSADNPIDPWLQHAVGSLACQDVTKMFGLAFALLSNMSFSKMCNCIATSAN